MKYKHPYALVNTCQPGESNPSERESTPSERESTLSDCESPLSLDTTSYRAFGHVQQIKRDSQQTRRLELVIPLWASYPYLSGSDNGGGLDDRGGLERSRPS